MATRPSLWVEIGVNLALLTILVAVVDAGVLYVANRVLLEDTAGAAALGTVTALGAELAAVDEERWGEVAARYHRAGAGRVLVYGPNGELKVGTGERGGATVTAVYVTRSATTYVEGDLLRAVAPVGVGRPRGVVELRMDLTDLGAPLWAIVLAHGTAAAVLVALFGFVLFRRSVIEPVERMRATTAEIAAGQFGTLVAGDAPRELADLARSLNLMSEALRAYKARTAEQLDHLAEANRELRATRDALVRSERLAVTGRLAAGIAHEIGNPLTSVRGYLEILEASADPAGPDSALLARAGREAERIHELLRSLLDHAREEHLTVGRVEVATLFSRACATVQLLPSFREVRFTLDVPRGLEVRCDEARLHQALVNLLLNAGAAGARGVTLRARSVATGTELEVEDDGAGIPAELVSRVFEPFFTTRPPGEGTGLGLWIVHRIVEQHDGAVSVVSEVGRGTTFQLTLGPGRTPTG